MTIFETVVSKTKAILNLMDPKPVGRQFLLRVDPIGSVTFVIKLLTWLPPQYHAQPAHLALLRLQHKRQGNFLYVAGPASEGVYLILFSNNK